MAKTTRSSVRILESNDTRDHNTFIGKDAGRKNRFGSRNTCIGDSSNLSSAILNNAIAIGYKAIVDADYKVRIGNDSPIQKI